MLGRTRGGAGSETRPSAPAPCRCSRGLLAASAGSSQALTKPAFVARGNAICESYYRRLNRLALPAMTMSGLAAYEREQLPLALTEQKELEAVVPPAADRQTYRTWLGVEESVVGVIKKIIVGGDRNDAVAMNRLIARAEALERSYDALAAKLGLSVCAQPTTQTK